MKKEIQVQNDMAEKYKALDNISAYRYNVDNGGAHYDYRGIAY